MYVSVIVYEYEFRWWFGSSLSVRVSMCKCCELCAFVRECENVIICEFVSMLLRSCECV